MEIAKKLLPLIIVILFSFPTITPLFARGFFPMHDDTQPTRVYLMAQALDDGQFPVRWVSDLGYGHGYPIFNFYAPLPYYIGAIGVIGGLDVITATKLMFAIGTILAGVSMFLLGRCIWGTAGGFIVATLYMYAPYHAVQMYVRGAVGEYWAYGMLPLVGLGIWKIYHDRHIQGILLTALGIAGVVTSHNIIGFITGGFLLLGLILSGFIERVLQKRFPKVALSFSLGLLLGLGLAAFFWLPALAEARYTKIHTLIHGSNDFRKHFVYLDQLWDSPWGYAGSSPGRADGMSFKIGKSHIFLGLLGLLSVVVAAQFNKSNRAARPKVWLVTFLIANSFISVFMLLPDSNFFWEALRPLAYIQYPWRFLVFALFWLSLAGGGVVNILKPKWKLIICASFIIGVVFVNSKYFQPQFGNTKTTPDYIEKLKMRWDISRISDEYLPTDFPIPKTQAETAQEAFATENDIIIESVEERSHLIKLVVSAAAPAEIVFSPPVFPGWQVVIDATKARPLTQDGQLAARVGQGRHLITVYFADTPIRRIANLVSLASIATVLVLVIKKRSVYEER